MISMTVCQKIVTNKSSMGHLYVMCSVFSAFIVNVLAFEV